MSPNEIKLLSASPSIKNWPLSLAAGALVAMTGVLSLVLLFTSAYTALIIAIAGVSLTVRPIFQAANTEYFVSNLRVAVRAGFFSKTERSFSMSDIREVRIARTSLQDMLGIGDLELVGAGEKFVLEGVEEPEKIREKILSLR